MKQPRDKSALASPCVSKPAKTWIDLITAIPGPASLHRMDGELVEANERFKDAFSIAATNNHKLSYLDRVNPQDRVSVLSAIGNPDDLSGPVSLRCQRTDAKGAQAVSTFHMECASIDAEGTDALVLCTFTDVTALVDSLELARSDREVLNERASEQRGFFAAMSHELRTPLNAIIGFSEMLEGKAAIALKPDQRAEYAGLINQSAVHLLDVINDVLDLSKLQAGGVKAKQEAIDILSLAHETVDGLLPLAMAKKLNIDVTACDELPEVTSDQRALRQILTNLLSNAIKFSKPERDISLDLTRRRASVEVSVIDQGIGMDRETLSKLGTVFFQAEHAVSRDYEGTGLGLSIVYGLANTIGAEIQVQSQPDVGTCFTVQIPTARTTVRPVPIEPEQDVVYLSKRAPSSAEYTFPLKRKTG